MTNVEPTAVSSTSEARQSASAPSAENVRIGIVARSQQQPAVLVVDVDQPEPGALGGEERRLGGEVVVDVAVEVEVVAAEVEEDRDVEDDPVDPAHHERVARDLHRADLHAALAHHREQAVQVGRLRRRERGLHVLAGDPGADGADHRRPDPGRSRPLSASRVVVVLPWVPVTPIIRIAAAGSPYTRAARRAEHGARVGRPRAPGTSTRPASRAGRVGEHGDRTRRDRGGRRSRHAVRRGRPGSAAYRSPGRTRCELSETPGDARRRRGCGADGPSARQPRGEVVASGVRSGRRGPGRGHLVVAQPREPIAERPLTTRRAAATAAVPVGGTP